MILTASGDEYRPQAAPTTILDADGKAYEPPDVLAKDEFEIIRKAFGLNRRNQTTITRRVLRLGKLSDTVIIDEEGNEQRYPHRVAALINAMAEQGLVKLFIDAKGLSKKNMAKVKNGDLSAGKLIVEVTQRGANAFFETVRQARAAQELPE